MQVSAGAPLTYLPDRLSAVFSPGGPVTSPISNRLRHRRKQRGSGNTSRRCTAGPPPDRTRRSAAPWPGCSGSCCPASPRAGNPEPPSALRTSTAVEIAEVAIESASPWIGHHRPSPGHAVPSPTDSAEPRATIVSVQCPTPFSGKAILLRRSRSDSASRRADHCARKSIFVGAVRRR